MASQGNTRDDGHISGSTYLRTCSFPAARTGRRPCWAKQRFSMADSALSCRGEGGREIRKSQGGSTEARKPGMECVGKERRVERALTSSLPCCHFSLILVPPHGAVCSAGFHSKRTFQWMLHRLGYILKLGTYITYLPRYVGRYARI